jgi:thiol-disulfide isomerase/thioredoxin
MKSFFNIENNQTTLRVAAFVGLIWGFLVPLIPLILENFLGPEAVASHSEFLQCVAIVFGIMGIGYFIASFDPGRHWAIIFVGFLMNFFLALNFLKTYLTGMMPGHLALFLLLNTLIWIIPFTYILLASYEENTVEPSSPKRFHDLINFVRTNNGDTLLELSSKNNVLLVFVRHFGCTFCRETVSEISKLEQAIAGKKLTLVFVHMSDPTQGDEFFSRYYDHPIFHVSDPSRSLYKSLNLKRGSFFQLFGPMIWLKGIWAGIFKGHGIGIEGDILQLGGFFVLSNGQIVFEQKVHSASEIFEFNTLPEL